MRLLGSEDADFVHIFFIECIHAFLTYKGFILLCYQWQENESGPLCPFASILGRSASMSWQRRLCLLGLQLGMSGCEQREKRDQNKREEEERGKSRHKLAEKHQRAA